MSNLGTGTSLVERVRVLAAWLRRIPETESWRPYCRMSQVQQCKHPDRASELEKLYALGRLPVSQINNLKLAEQAD